MTLRLLVFMAVSLLISSYPVLSHSQTCRVAVGVNSEGVTTYMEVYECDYVEEKPEFPGGECKLMSFINEQRRYPADAYRAGIEGRVICSFVVNADGKVSNVSVLRGVEASLNKEALRILSRMPQWSPGRLKGEAVPVRVVRAVPFRR